MPYPNEHSCRLRDPDEFQEDSFSRMDREHEGKTYSVIMGRLKGEKTLTEQAYRYPKDDWSEDEARAHCQDHDGIEFAPATGGRNMSICCLEKVSLEGIRPPEFRFVGSPRNPYGTHASKGYPGGRDAWKKAWRIYLSCVRDQGPIQGTIRRVSMIAAGMEPKCDIPSMSAEDIGPRSGKCGCLEGKIYQKPADYDLSEWKKPSDDDLDQEDIQLTCQDLTDIKRICLQEIAKRQACAEEEESQRRVIVDEMGIERRFVSTELRVLDVDGEPHIEGYAAVFNQWSDDLGWFREMIRPGAFAKTIQEADVRALWQHDSRYVLGRKASGTLQLVEDETGLHYKAHPPDTQWARDALVTMRRGDVTQSSFTFEVVRDVWSQNENGIVTRELVEVKLYDVSPVTFPAYPQTSVAVRAKVMELRGEGLPSEYPFAPGQEPHPDGSEDGSTRARLDIRRKQLELIEIEM